MANILNNNTAYKIVCYNEVDIKLDKAGNEKPVPNNKKVGKCSITFALSNYIDNSFTLLGNAIYSYNIITGVFVKIYDFYSTTNSYLTLIFYNMKLYTCDSTKKIIVIDIASKIASTYTTLPENTRNLNIDSSGNMMFICNRNVYTINLQNNLNSFPTITVADSIYTIPSTTPNGRDGVAIDSSGNIYYATISELRKVNKINGVYQATVSLGTGSYISDIKSFSDGIYLIEGKWNSYLNIVDCKTLEV
jgi:hypothetical protein